MAFNPEQFLNTEIVGATSTEYVPVPEGEWLGVCSDVSIRTVNFKDGNTGYSLTSMWDIDDPECKAEMDVERSPKVRMDFLLEIDDSTGGLKAGKGENVRLGKLRDALGLNDPNKPFNLNMVKGQAATLQVSHRLGDDGQIFSEVKQVTKV